MNKDMHTGSRLGSATSRSSSPTTSCRGMSVLGRNPAAVRCCLVQGEFTLSWLEALMASVAAIDATGSGVRTWH